jgi:methylsterol monooxygenase
MTIKTNARSQLTLQPLMFYIVVWPLFLHFGSPDSLTAPIPSVLSLVLQFFVCLVFNEFFFYWTHRAMHASQWFYVHVHKQVPLCCSIRTSSSSFDSQMDCRHSGTRECEQHHQYNGPMGFASEYAHPVEQVISNQIPTIGGALFFGFHPLVWFVWLAWRLFITYAVHV